MSTNMRQAGSIARRTLLRGVTAGSILSLCGGMISVARAAARDPWSAWQSLPDATAYPDPRVRAVAYGILSPNVQNFQPWLVTLVGEDRLLVGADLSRRLPVSDPIDRQLTVSFGTFAELLSVGASIDGFRLETTLFPDGEPGPALDGEPILAVRFVRDGAVQRSPLVDQVLKRSTNRLPFDVAKQVTAEQIAALKAGAHDPALVDGTVDEARAARLRDIAHRSYVFEMAHARVRRELVNVTRIGRAEAVSYAWGPASLGPSVEQGLTDGTLSRMLLDDPGSDRFRAGQDAYLKAVDSARAYVWVMTPDNTRRSMFEGGREWARLHLAATAMGLKMQPHSQALHDYSEIEPPKAELLAAVGGEYPARLQMFGRIGYAADAPHSPRGSRLHAPHGLGRERISSRPTSSLHNTRSTGAYRTLDAFRHTSH